MSAAAASNEIILIAVPGPAPAPNPWIIAAIGAAALAAGAALAYRRWRRPDLEAPRRGGRILRSAIAGATALTAMHAPDAYLRFNPFGGSIGLELAAELVGLTIVALMMLIVADLLLDALRPRRNGRWLALGPALLTAFGAGVLAGSGWLEPLDRAPAPGRAMAMLVAAMLVAGLVWWSYLPGTRSDPARVFD